MCRRGIKLNFMETKAVVPDVLIPVYPQYFAICDESRVIAAEYKDGLKNYPDVSETPRITTLSSTLTSGGTTSTTVNGITSTNTIAAHNKTASSTTKTNDQPLIQPIEHLPSHEKYVLPYGFCVNLFVFLSVLITFFISNLLLAILLLNKNIQQFSQTEEFNLSNLILIQFLGLIPNIINPIYKRTLHNTQTL